MIAKGVITRRANEEHLPAQTIERDYILAHLCAEIGSIGEPRLVFKGGTLLRLCYFSSCRYSADLDFSAVNGLSNDEALGIVAAARPCRLRIELPMLEVSDGDSETAWVAYKGPLDRGLAGSSSTCLILSWSSLIVGSTYSTYGPTFPRTPASRVTASATSLPRRSAALPSGFSAGICTTSTSCSTADTSILSKPGICTSTRRLTTC